jgi:hypothetical protein
MAKVKSVMKKYWTAWLLTVCCILLCVIPHTAQATDVTKSQGQLYPWTLLDDVGGTPYLETGVHTYTDTLSSTLNVAMVNIGAVADASSVGFKVFVRYGAADDGWRLWRDLKADVAVAVTTVLDAESAAAQAVINVTATAGFDAVTQIGDTYFIKDATLANSELVIWGGVHADAATITVIDNLVRTHAVTTSSLYAVVSQWPIYLPNGCDEAKVVFYNQDADANYACRVDYANEDDIE